MCSITTLNSLSKTHCHYILEPKFTFLLLCKINVLSDLYLLVNLYNKLMLQCVGLMQKGRRKAHGTEEHPLWEHKAGNASLTSKSFIFQNIDDLHYCQLAHFLLTATWLWLLSFLPVVFSRCSLPRARISVILNLSFASSLGRLPAMSRLWEGWWYGIYCRRNTKGGW